MNSQGIQVAIDGPASAGKSTVAKLVAKEFEYIYVDTGAMYRAVTLAVLENSISLNNEEEITKLVSDLKIDFAPGNPVQKVFLNNKEVTNEIRSNEVNNNVSLIASYEGVRKELVKQQQMIANSSSVVMDGRDIGTTVLPNADLKIFLIASVEQRAERRYKENQENGIDISFDDLKKSISNRDYKDTHRDISPLRKAKDAYEIDSTSKGVSEVVDEISSLIKQKI
ncbi:(d)CMP kinase [Lactobacillus sp. S2-2]|uniref:(d)CMP kinase n=1 Tax=Lactobacillus sp. S2-2 TaxID=2692917 RepID=UPI001F02A313|nr:(d)CMP kinase [Lactobacillus sp. S2-2]MCF6515019.1 (d)CMP kinase [Lactobacillus sp. S2-2]